MATSRRPLSLSSSKNLILAKQERNYRQAALRSPLLLNQAILWNQLPWLLHWQLALLENFTLDHVQLKKTPASQRGFVSNLKPAKAALSATEFLLRNCSRPEHPAHEEVRNGKSSRAWRLGWPRHDILHRLGFGHRG